VIISEWFYIKPTADRRQRLRPARPAVNIGVSETERRSPSAVSVPLPPSSSAAAAHCEASAASDVAASLSPVATTSSSSSSLLSSVAAGAHVIDHSSTSTSDNGDSDATVLYSSNGLSTGDVVV